MPEIDGTNKGTGGAPHNSARPHIRSEEIDLQALAAGDADVINVLNIEAGVFVQQVFVEIMRPAVGTSAAADVGDGANADGFDAAIDLKAAAGTIYTSSLALTEGTPNVLTDAYGGGKVYSAADTIDLVLAHTAVTDAGKVKVSALCVEI